MKKFPVLYKKTSTGKIQTWEVWVEGAVMHSESGQLDGKKIKSEDTIKEGKNIGKANETTKEQQALLEAEARWTAKTKKGYTITQTGAAAGKVEDVIEGGLNPMLAKSYADQGEKILFPCAVQPKLDGIRCVAIGSSLWTRTRKPIRSVPHIAYAVDNVGDPSTILDGELYNHEFKNDFEKITTIVGQKKDVDPNHELCQYHVYDMPMDAPFAERIKTLQALCKKLGKKSPIKLVETVVVNDEVELDAAYERFKAEGYEGAMVRNLNSPYEYKRSNHLQKMKEFQDAEFKIIGVEEGRGKLQGHAGAFVCATKNGAEFKAKMAGETSKLKEYWDNQEGCIGKKLTVKFQGLTSGDVPRFPVGKAIRNYE
jgi:DNA ligase-1